MEDQIIKEILVTEDQIKKRVKELGEQITKDYQGKEPVVVGILKGAVVFLSDLIRELKIPIHIDFMAVSSYGKSSMSTGEVRIIKDLDFSVEGKDIIIVEDIIDTGLTLGYLKELLNKRGAKSVKICTLLDKPERRKVDIDVDYKGFIIPDEFIIGYGLDFNEKYRNYSFVAALKEEYYK
ncbi:hypoxanthine phosphoribosyltransferase [Soehngenia longivitae]|uniref:Hypoxanthine phosphoribosyltransferase n=1 Tax=Soehngenia longivitae TaxID=2562294 RepID=A0A4Z0D1L1_9FIRM|nr:hypoxanthine phosphoribosyltransferase [Soehngenia longivitae]TFZ39641.1 hypoxanthine phosphoribosyltransferase [Soehngenia longivitae]